MDIINKPEKYDYTLEYYTIVLLSFLTFKKINKIEKLKSKLKRKKAESKNWHV